MDTGSLLTCTSDSTQLVRVMLISLDGLRRRTTQLQYVPCLWSQYEYLKHLNQQNRPNMRDFGGNLCTLISVHARCWVWLRRISLHIMSWRTVVAMHIQVSEETFAALTASQLGYVMKQRGEVEIKVW